MFKSMEGIRTRSSGLKEYSALGEDIDGRQWTCRYTELEMKYLSMDGNIKSRDLKLYMPIAAEADTVPLIVAVHYEIPDGYKMLTDYLKAGCAVLSPANVPMEHMENLSGDNLLFNMGMVDLARRLDFVDKDRIVLRGGSAGGYMALMLTAMHMGVLCTYCMYGITNMLYQQRYLQWNNRFNEAYEADVTESEKSSITNYPMPYVKLAYDLIADTGRFIGMDGQDSERWLLYSPVTYLKEMVHPIILYHSSADIMVPINQLTERYSYSGGAEGLPGAFKEKMGDYMGESKGNTVLTTPMTDMIAPGDMAVFILTYDAPDIKVDREKQFNINIFDEGGKSKDCAHFKNQAYGDNEAELGGVGQYLTKKACETNGFTIEKLRIMEQRYNGILPVTGIRKDLKENCGPGIFGSLCSDRLDVLVGIALYLGMDFSILKNGRATECREVNLEIFNGLYDKLENNRKFISKDIETIGFTNTGNIPEMVAILIGHYYDQCGRVKME